MQISRDPFARTTLHRRTVEPPHPKAGCTWCGDRTARGKLYEYSTHHDSGRQSPHKGLFCGKQCHDVYHEK